MKIFRIFILLTCSTLFLACEMPGIPFISEKKGDIATEVLKLEQEVANLKNTQNRLQRKIKEKATVTWSDVANEFSKLEKTKQETITLMKQKSK